MINRIQFYLYRLDLLKREIEFQMDRIKNDENEELLEITYLFYDEI
jgi:hypothetical protein